MKRTRSKFWGFPAEWLSDFETDQRDFKGGLDNISDLYP
jgi:hypothetical protein